MTSGHHDNNTCPKVNPPPGELPLAWLQEAYADCDEATVVVDPQGKLVMANDRARRWLSIDIDDVSSELALGDGTTLGDLVDIVLDNDRSTHHWRGAFEGRDIDHVEIQCTRLPAPTPLVLVQFVQFAPSRQPNHEVRARLVTELTNLSHEHDDLQSVGEALVNSVYRHLDTATVAHWVDEGEKTFTWYAGDRDACARLEESALTDIGASTESLTCVIDDDAEAIIISFAIADAYTATLAICGRSEHSPAPPSSPFWICLAATAKTTLQSARLLELHRQERLRLRTVLEHMPIAVMLFDTDGRVLDLNLRARAMAGRRTWEYVGAEDNPFEVCDPHGNTLPRAQWPFLRAVERGICCDEEEYVLDFGDHQRTISITVIPITDDNDHVTSYLATGRDVTQRSEEDQRKDEFLSVASHELRSPLTPLAGFVQLSRQQAESGEPVDVEVLERAEYQVRRLQRLIDGLLDRTRLKTGKLPVHRTRVQMTSLVRRIMRPWLEGPHGQRVQLTVPDESLEAEVDPARIDQVLTNVVDNAIKHGRSDGAIDVRLRGDSDCIVLTVRDEGDGIPPKIIDRVFDRYFHVRGDNTSSTGLGLYVARQIVEDHGGTIDIDSGRGQPTTVTIRLPMV